MKANDVIGVTFVNTVVGRGVLHGVVNLSFSVFNFTPSDDGKTVALDPTIACRLRMDKLCATQLRDVMNELLATIEKAEAQASAGTMETPTDGVVTKTTAKELN